jgi:hypothetical protein
MRDSHQNLKITASEWDAFIDDLQTTLDRFGVPSGEQEELKLFTRGARRGRRRPPGYRGRNGSGSTPAPGSGGVCATFSTMDTAVK